MPGITGMGTTFNLPNFPGELFAAAPQDTPLLSSIGGLTGGRPTQSTHFNWSGYDLRAAQDNRQRLEGANAPQAEERTRYVGHNVVEIHQEALALSYTKMAATAQLASIGAAQPNVAYAGGANAVTDEEAWQMQQILVQVARDVEASFITGTFNDPTDNTTARRTRGLLQAITTNVVAAGGPLTQDLVLTLMQDVWTNGGIGLQDTATLMVGAQQKRALTQLFVTDAGYAEATRNVGGVNLQTIETDFGMLNIMLNRNMPNDSIVVLSLEQLAPRFLEIPGKGHFFVEPLAKTGASNNSQLYGEIGLEYGDEKAHGKITGLT